MIIYAAGSLAMPCTVSASGRSLTTKTRFCLLLSLGQKEVAGYAGETAAPAKHDNPIPTPGALPPKPNTPQFGEEPKF